MRGSLSTLRAKARLILIYSPREMDKKSRFDIRLNVLTPSWGNITIFPQPVGSLILPYQDVREDYFARRMESLR